MKKTDIHFLKLCKEGASQEALQEAIAAGADINVTDSNGRTGMILAAIKKKHGTIASLMRLRANIQHKDDFGYTVDDYLNMRDGYSIPRKIADKTLKKGRFSKEEMEEGRLVNSATALADLPDNLMGTHKHKETL